MARWHALFVFLAVLSPHASRSEGAPLSHKTIEYFDCTEKFAAELDDHRSDADTVAADVALRCSKQFEAMAEEGADEETHHLMERESFLRAAREHQNELAIVAVQKGRAKDI